MSYNYQSERHKIFTEEGQRMFLAIRDHSRQLLATAGAFRMDRALDKAGGGDSWTMIACVDRMVELREIREITTDDVPGQHRVFAALGA